MKPTNLVFTGLETTIFETMSRLANEHGAVNLGQGFPDVDGPEDVRRVAAEAFISGPNQYPPMLGLPELRQAVAHDDSHGRAVVHYAQSLKLFIAFKFLHHLQHGKIGRDGLP